MDATATTTDVAVGRSALRKAGWRLLPLVALGYGLAMIDRGNISFAKLQMNQDLGFSEAIYGFGAGVFFLSYTAFEIPSNLLLHRVGARRWIARIMLTWGVIAMGMMFVRTPLQFYVARFLLGFAEAGFFPGVVYYLTQWFPSEARGRALSRFIIANPLSGVVMGAVAGWLLGLNGVLGLRGWQWLFVLEGLPTVVLAFVYLFRLPDAPETAAWLTPQERSWLTGKLAAEKAGLALEPQESAMKALSDRRVWLLAACYLSTTAAFYAYQFYAPSIVKAATGLADQPVGLIVAGMSLAGVVAVLVNGMLLDRTPDRRLNLMVPALIMAGAYVASGLVRDPWVMIACLSVVWACANSLIPALWAIPAGFLKSRSAAAGLAAINTIGNIGGFFGPNWMAQVKIWTGDYRVGLISLAVPCVLAVLILMSLKPAPAKAEEGG
jgi:ACS family tartrate transporter-like MFS transporter